MEIFAYIYVSKPKIHWTKDQISELAFKAQVANSLHGITGILCFHDNNFIQYIEGPGESLRQLKNNLRNDPRHSIVDEAWLGVQSDRQFHNWDLKLFDPQSIEAYLPDFLKFLVEHFWESVGGSKNEKLIMLKTHLKSLQEISK